jgi:hypothetical protein
MKPEQWVIDDMRSLRKKSDKTPDESEYMELLVWYVSVLNGKESK